jgi:hypothetical protein
MNSSLRSNYWNCENCSGLAEKFNKCRGRSEKPIIRVSRIVKDTCSVYISKGRISNTASKLLALKNNCIRISK